MDILTYAPITVNLFGGLDISVIGLLLIAAGIIAAAVVVGKGRKKGDVSLKKLALIGGIIVAAGLLAGCGVSALTDTTEAVSASSYITIFGLTLPVERVLLTLNFGGGYSIYWYGCIIAFGFMLALIYGYRRAPEFGIDRDRMLDVILVGLVAAIFFARLFYVAFDGVPMTSIWDFFAIHDGGIVIYGGVIGAFLFGGAMAKIRKVDVLSMFDVAALGFLIGQSVGRWGNFVNQEVYGRETGSTWFGMTGSTIRLEYGDALVHPLFLYESLWCLLIFIFLHMLSKKQTFKGQLFCSYFVLYGFGRFFFEGMRDHSFILKMGVGISLSQFISVIAVVGGIALYLILRRKGASTADGYDNQFGELLDDPEMLDDAFALLGCEWDADDDEINAAYEEQMAFFSEMETENDTQRANVEAKIAEIERAYQYILDARRAENVTKETETPEEEENGSDN